MSGSRKNSKKDDGGGFGLGAALLLAGGAATVGYLARDLWNSYQEFQAQPSSSSTPPPGSRAPPGNTWDSKPDTKLGKRKQLRDKSKNLNIPDEMRCVVCWDNPREVCMIPCGHVSLCEDCAEKVEKKCPICNQPIQNKKAIFI